MDVPLDVIFVAARTAVEVFVEDLAGEEARSVVGLQVCAAAQLIAVDVGQESDAATVGQTDAALSMQDVDVDVDAGQGEMPAAHILLAVYLVLEDAALAVQIVLGPAATPAAAQPRNTQ